MKNTVYNIGATVYNIGAVILVVVIVCIWAFIMLLAMIVNGIIALCHHIGKGGNNE